MSIILDHVFAKISAPRLCLSCTNTNYSQTLGSSLYRRPLAHSVFSSNNVDNKRTSVVNPRAIIIGGARAFSSSARQNLDGEKKSDFLNVGRKIEIENGRRFSKLRCSPKASRTRACVYNNAPHCVYNNAPHCACSGAPHGRPPTRQTSSLVRLSPQVVTGILQRNEVSVSQGLGPSIARYDCNMLESNSPVEDRAAEAKCVYTTGNLFGVFDGHAGPGCAQATSERLFQYIGLSLLPPHLLEELLVEAISLEDDQFPRVVKWLGGPDDAHTRYFQEILAQTYSKSMLSFAEDLLKEHEHFEKPFRMEEALAKSFSRLDQDFSKEALTKAASKGPHDNDALDIAFSGAVASVAHVDGIHIHVACCGDVQAVLGSLEDDGVTWSAKPLTVLHNSDNKKEMSRLLAEHPGEGETIVRNERLLGQLIPLRAFGDVRFKWSADDIATHLNPYVSYNVVPQFYHTPPYLHAIPEVSYHRLTPRDRFLVIASDGLWDMMTPSQVVNVVGSWKRGIQSLKPFQLPEDRPMTINEILQRLKLRVEGRNAGIADENSATHLIRHALGGTESGVDHRRLSSMLALPQDVSRLYRDDITISVLHFNLNYLRTHPA